MNPEEAARSARHLAAIVASSEDAIVSKDLNGIITSWNRAAVRLFGYEPEEAIGRSIRMLIPADRQQEEDHVLARIRSGNVVDHFETVRVRKDGTEIDISLTVSPIRSEDGTIVGASKIARDITERKRLAAALAAAETKNRLLAEVTESLARSLDHRHMLVELTSLMVPAFADVCVAELLHHDGTRERYPAHAQEPPLTDRVVRSGAAVLVGSTTDGSAAAAGVDPELQAAASRREASSLIVVPLRVRAAVIGVVAFVNTVSRRTYRDRDLQFAEGVVGRVALAVENARAYHEAREANRLKDDFLATLSHELRTPLNAILGYTRMLRTRTVAADRRDAALEVVERNATSLAQIVNDVLDISRVVQGKLAMNVQPVVLSRLVDDAVATLLPAATAKGVQIRARVAQDVQTIVADPDRMQQVLWNLLSNGVKFTPRGGQVTLDASRNGSEIELVVSDTGEGIPLEFLPFVFERFRQADSRPAGVRGGLGIGLAICRHIVEMHGGRIHATSDGPGKGATFHVTLPIASPVAEPASLTG